MANEMANEMEPVVIIGIYRLYWGLGFGYYRGRNFRKGSRELFVSCLQHVLIALHSTSFLQLLRPRTAEEGQIYQA